MLPDVSMLPRGTTGPLQALMTQAPADPLCMVQIWETAVEAASNQEGPAHAATAKEVAARLHEIGKHEPAADMLLAVGDAEVSLAIKLLWRAKARA